MLLALTGCMLLFGVVTGNLQFIDVLWAGGGIGAVLAITTGVMRALFPYLKETRRWERFTESVGTSLILHSRGGVKQPSLSGRIYDCHVSVTPVGREQLIVVAAPPSALQTGSHEIAAAARTPENRAEPWIALGDPEFDGAIVLRGSLPEVVAVL